MITLIRNAVSMTALFALAACAVPDEPQPANEPAAATAPTAQPAAAAPGSAPTQLALDESGPVNLDSNVTMPAGLEDAKVSPGECMAPVDYFNDKPVQATYTAGQPVVVKGWNITSSKTEPTPAIVLGVFKPYDASSSGSVLTGARTKREDVAAGNPAMLNSGFQLSGSFPSTAGRYRLYLLTGDSETLTECDTRLVITLN